MAAMRQSSEICERYRINSCRTSNVWLPSLSRLRPFRTCFSVTCPRLDENDGFFFILFYTSMLISHEAISHQVCPKRGSGLYQRNEYHNWHQ